MANKDLEVDPDLLQSVHGQAADALASTLVGQLRDMRAGIDALNACWEGPNHKDFVGTFEQRMEGVASFNEVMGRYLEALKKAQEIYVKREEDAATFAVNW